MTGWQQVGFWVAALLAALILLWLISAALLPFVIGLAIAYLFDPVARRLQRAGLSRVAATALMLCLFLIAVSLALIVLVPVLSNQAAGLIERMPDYFASLQEFVTRHGQGLLGRLAGVPGQDGGPKLAPLAGQSAGWLSRLLASVWSGGQAVFSVVSLLIIAPVVAFYLLIDWDPMVAKIDSWLPRPHRETIHAVLAEMDRVVAAFIRGQIGVCLAMAAFYAIGMALIGLNYGILIGVAAGLLGFVPYVGFSIGLIASVGVAIMQFWPDWPWIAAVVAVFTAGQLLEGYVLQPNWVGKSVGLHPVWLLFALFAFGSLFGFVGLLVAVPAAACIGVLARFALERYLESPLHLGATTDPTPDGHDQ